MNVVQCPEANACPRCGKLTVEGDGHVCWSDEAVEKFGSWTVQNRRNRKTKLGRHAHISTKPGREHG